MDKIYRIGIIGIGLMGRLHIEALHRIPGLEVIAVTGAKSEDIDSFCRELFIPHGYDDYKIMLGKENLDAVHVCSPNFTHFSICKELLLNGIHVYCEKPLANTTEEAAELCRIAKEKNLITGVNFNYRHNAIVQDMCERVKADNWGRTFLIHGHYLQDWMMYDDDYNWRCIPELGGPSRTIADIGSHWFDTVQFITGKKIVRVFAKLMTLIEQRKKYTNTSNTFELQPGEDYELIDIDSEDAAFIMIELEDGTCGSLVLSQVSGGHKNHFVINVDGSHYAMGWDQESPDQLLVQDRKLGTLLIRAAPDTLHGSAVKYATLPGGHVVAWTDALTNAIRQFYNHLRFGGEKNFTTFEDGHSIVKLVEACLKSNRNQCWININ